MYCHGERHPKAKLSEEDVRSIRALREAGMSYPRIARKFGLGVMTVWSAANYWTWTHVR